ncbi:glycerophosphodiester phosphodiesterase family protein [Antarcticirhabdus aurantiaca]|uniref:Glycerophosphodiester phosphodiesterase family protein n=1 Tax=Antarcticirhabdus aurantiaca TaxID=2606717 RepID=A0ACD4NS08_9HYPH|nr:glycerophosphodiester phosphodiesterase family protein [Antarcticirhabdus aurantiaca]WAJ29770.1 glycerophosphodiester phosphodiesterase family protein [Jeongeuplla avenae]
MPRTFRAFILLVLPLFLGAVPGPASAEETRSDAIVERFRDANAWRGHVMVVAHRGGWMEDGEIRLAENSLSALERAVELGVEMIEVDVQVSRDGEFVVLHDTSLDRTTTCKGEAADKPLAEIRQCRLVVEGTGEVTGERVPTLRELLSAAKDRVMVNLDSKLGIENLTAMIAMARELGMADQIVSKAYVDTPEKLAAALEVHRATGDDIQFMPQLSDEVVADLAPFEAAVRELTPEAAELRNAYETGEPLTADGGLFFRAESRALAARYDLHLWINTLYDDTRNGMRSGGRGDEMAVRADLPGEVWGFWAEQGATMIQTDEPKAAIAWLEANGYRIPYED